MTPYLPLINIPFQVDFYVSLRRNIKNGNNYPVLP